MESPVESGVLREAMPVQVDGVVSLEGAEVQLHGASVYTSTHGVRMVRTWLGPILTTGPVG